jgi:hypothetical protein
MRRPLSSRYLARIALYSFIALLFLLTLWFFVQKDESLYAYYGGILAALFFISLVTLGMNVVVIFFSLYDLIIGHQPRSAVFILLQLFSAAASAAAGVYAGVLHIGY